MYVCMYVCIYRAEIGGFTSQMRITFVVNANHFGQLIRNIFGSLRISLG